MYGREVSRSKSALNEFAVGTCLMYKKLYAQQLLNYNRRIAVGVWSVFL
jgi:hypothetical protein